MTKWLNSLLLMWVITLGLSACGGGSSGDSAELTDVIITGISSPTVDNEYNLNATATYSDRTTKNVTTEVSWKSSNTDIATVTAEGVVTALAPGDVSISAKYQDLEGIKKVVIKDKKRIRRIDLSGVPQNLIAGQTYQLHILALAAEQDDLVDDEGNILDSIEEIEDEYHLFEYESSDEELLTIDSESGEIQALADGTVTLKVIAKENDAASNPIEFTIEPAIDSIELDDELFYIEFGTGKDVSISVSATLSDGSTKDVTNQTRWLYSKSSDEDPSAIILSDFEINASGIINAGTTGTFFVKASLGDHISEKTAKIVVENPLNLVATKDYGGEIQVNWNTMADASEYTLYWDSEPGISTDTANSETFTDITEFTLSDVTIDQTYYFRINFLRENTETYSELSPELAIKPIRGDWNFKPGLPNLREGGAAITFQDEIYVFGGMRINDANESVISNKTSHLKLNDYNPNKPWESVISLPEARKGMSACLHNENIYLFGGINADDSYSAQILKYLPLNAKWESGLANLPVALAYTSCVTVGDKIYITGGIGDSGAANTVYIFDPLNETAELIEAPTLGQARYLHGSAVVNGRLFVAGGTNGTDILPSVTSYAPETDDAWRDELRMNDARSGFALISISDKLYAFGGTGFDQESLRSVESVNTADPESAWQAEKSMPFANTEYSATQHEQTIYFYGGLESATATSAILATSVSYDSTLNQWFPNAQALAPSTEFSSAVLNDRIYLVGGKTSLDISLETAAYDLTSQKWSGKDDGPIQPAPLDQQRAGASSVTYIDNIYLIGGHTTGNELIKEVVRWDPKTNAWFDVGELRSPRSYACTVVYNERIYVIGGIDPKNNEFVSTIENYDPARRSWEYIAELPTPRAGSTCVVIDDAIYMIGGVVLKDDQLHPTNRVDVFYPKGSRFSFSNRSASLSKPRVSPAAAMLNGNIYIFGGFTFTVSPNRSFKFTDISEREPIDSLSVERYVPINNVTPEDSNAWSILSPLLPVSFDHLQAHNYKNKIVLIGSNVTDLANSEITNHILFFE